MRLFLNGGGSDTQIVSALKIMNRVIVHDKPLLYIPVAMDEREHSYDDCYDWICSQLVNISIPRIDIVDFSKLIGPVIAYPEEDMLFIDGNNIEMIGNRDYYYIDNGDVYKNILFNNDKD